MIDGHAVPRAPGVDDVEDWSGSPGLALAGGDDYELCFAIAPEDVDAVTRAVSPTSVTVVGRFVEGSGVEVSGTAAPPALRPARWQPSSTCGRGRRSSRC